MMFTYELYYEIFHQEDLSRVASPMAAVVAAAAAEKKDRRKKVTFKNKMSFSGYNTCIMCLYMYIM